MSKMQRLMAPPELLRIPLVGNYFRPSTAQELLKGSKEDRLCFLQPEPTNPHDKNAVRVLMLRINTLTLVGYTQRHFSAKLVAFIKTKEGYEKTDWITGIVRHVAGEDYEIIPFGLISKDDTGKMISIFTRDKPKYIEGVNKLLEGR